MEFRFEMDELELRAYAQRFAGLDSAALAAARARGPQARAPHPLAETLAEPPVSAREILEKIQQKAWPAIDPCTIERPEGPLSLHVGPRFTGETLLSDYTTPEEAPWVLAWPLPELVGRMLVARDIAALPDAIRALLAEVLGDLPFALHGDAGYGGPGKYHHVHASLVAPPMGRLPMAIELYGKLVGAGDLAFDTLEGARYLLSRERELFALMSRDEHAAPPDPDAIERYRTLTDGRDLPSPLYVQIESATYANVHYPGVNVPLYV